MACVYNTTSAQIFKRKYAKKEEKAPSMILVQLPRYENRMEFLTKSAQTAKAEQIRRDADSISAKMILDFTDNFNFCPVYYYYDNNAGKIKDGQYEGVVFDKNLQPVNANVITKNHVIALFGYNIQADSGYAGQTVNSEKLRLQILDPNLKRLQRPLPNGTNNVWARSKQDITAYQYESPMFNIYYHPYVAQYNAKLHVFYNKADKKNLKKQQD